MWDHNFPTRDQTHVPCIARQIFNQWTTGEVPIPLCNPCVSPIWERTPGEGCLSLPTCVWEHPFICPLPITEVSAAVLGRRGKIGKIGLKLPFDLFMNAKGDYWWKLLSPGTSYFWFDHLEALQGGGEPIARNDTPQGSLILQCFFFFPPSECYIISYSSVFFFKVLVHEVHIKVLLPHWL